MVIAETVDLESVDCAELGMIVGGIFLKRRLHFIGESGYIYWAYPLTWAISSTIYLIYYLRSDWVHGFER